MVDANLATLSILTRSNWCSTQNIKELSKLDQHATAVLEHEQRTEETQKGKKTETLTKKRGVAKGKNQHKAAGWVYCESVNQQGDAVCPRTIS